jgi:hypothetical protein
MSWIRNTGEKINSFEDFFSLNNILGGQIQYSKLLNELGIPVVTMGRPSGIAATARLTYRQIIKYVNLEQNSRKHM